MYKRFWFEFEIDSVFNYPPGVAIGVGITAIDYDNAVNIINKEFFLK